MKRGKRYSADFKAKIVLELLSGDKPLNQLCSAHGLVPKTVLGWKEAFLANASLAFNIEGVVSAHKEQLAIKETEVHELHRQLGKRTAEAEWAVKKLKSLDYDFKKNLIKSEPKGISIVKQCELLGFNRSGYYYQPSEPSAHKLSILRAIDETYTVCPFYGYRKVHQQLLDLGHTIGVNRVRDYMRELGLRVIYPTRAIQTTMSHPDHQKYPYLLRDMEINRANQVWGTDITYIRLNGGFVYLAAIIDWHSKAILSYKISNTMDSALVIGVLQEALEGYGSPEIFNTDQGSQYTSVRHTEILTEQGIKISMDGKGRATDNIAIERFWRSAKQENIYLSEYNTMAELKAGMAQYIDFYNTKRFHQTLGYQKPMEVYQNSISEQVGKAA